MRLHTDKLTFSDLYEALNEQKKAGRIAADVYFKCSDEHGSRDYARSYEVQLEALTKTEGDGRRQGNSGSYVAGDNYAATYDEWGWFLAALYARDDNMRAGSKGSPMYRDDDDFHTKTGLSYHPSALRSNLTWPNEESGEDPYPFTVQGSAGKAGQKGRGRSDGDYLPRSTYQKAVDNPGKLIDGYVRYVPRTLEDVPA